MRVRQAIQRECRRGFILAIALFVLVLMSALAAMLLPAVAEDAREARAGALRLKALAAAESAMYLAIARWDSALSASALVGRPVVARGTVVENGTTTISVSRVTRLDSVLYWVTGEASVTFGRESALQRVGMSVRQTSGAGGVVLRPLTGQGWAQLY